MYSVYLCRKRIGDVAYTATLIEGNGKHLHMVQKTSDVEANPKAAYMEAYEKAAHVIKSGFADGTLIPDDVTFYTHNITFAKWLQNMMGYDTAKAPANYRKQVTAIFHEMEALGTNYDVRVVSFNRASTYATPAAWRAQQEKNKPQKAVDAFAEWNVEE